MLIHPQSKHESILLRVIAVSYQTIPQHERPTAGLPHSLRCYHALASGKGSLSSRVVFSPKALQEITQSSRISNSLGNYKSFF